jgi:hypothetical protein
MKCPFKVGDLVVYAPSQRIIGHNVMTDFSALRPGEIYKIATIQNDMYVIPEGFEDTPAGGLVWEAFEASKT